jgi:hypothetical protein
MSTQNYNQLEMQADRISTLAKNNRADDGMQSAQQSK